jgi:2-dehydro-3-deoxygluconokinase
MNQVVTFGEAMLRLTPPNYQRLEQTVSLDVTVGGSELNSAIAISRLGMKSAWVSKLTSNPLGRIIANKAREQGVDTSHIVWTKEHRIGLYFLEQGATPRSSRVIYDRKNSAISAIQPNEVNWAEVFKGAKLFHTSGITPALSKSATETTKAAVKAAKAAGLLVSFDMNYRATLWSTDEARQCFTEILPDVDILLTTDEDTNRVFGYEGSYEEIAHKLKDTFGFKIVAITLRQVISVLRGGWSSLALADKLYKSKKRYEMEIIDRVGAGDSFTAGFLFGYLTEGIEKGIAYGDAMSAFKHSMPGDVLWMTEDEVKAQISGEDAKIKR